jgi:hypothetical protein
MTEYQSKAVLIMHYDFGMSQTAIFNDFRRQRLSASVKDIEGAIESAARSKKETRIAELISSGLNTRVDIVRGLTDSRLCGTTEEVDLELARLVMSRKLKIVRRHGYADTYLYLY